MKKAFERVRVSLLLAAVLLLLLTSPAAIAQEQSVKPGINDNWKSEDIEPLIGLLEGESREIYRERVLLAALVGPPAGGTIADVGAGSGFMAELFSDLVGPAGTVYAVDINSKLLERIAARAKEQGRGNLRTVLGKDDSIELPPHSVDIVFICDTYHHFEFPQRSLRSIHRALRPGGQIVLVDFRRIPGVSDEWMINHVRAGEKTFVGEITAAGFQLVNDHDVSFLTENYVLRFRKK